VEVYKRSESAAGKNRYNVPAGYNYKVKTFCKLNIMKKLTIGHQNESSFRCHLGKVNCQGIRA